ncbi:UNVERIFIED_CONTAM: hypothetical protein NCL1_09697 [Trichonephila clavipes]
MSKGLVTPVVSCSFEHHTGDSTIWLDSTPILRENTLEGSQRPLTCLPLPPTSREDLRLDGYLEYPHAAKTLYIYKYPCLLWDSNPVPTAQQSASLTTIPDGRRHYVESSPSPDITSSTWIMNSVNNNESNGTSIRENESSVLQYHQNSQETSENSQSSANLSEIPDTQQMQRFITADNQVVYGYKDPNGEFHFFCPAMNERESHNEKERKRRYVSFQVDESKS